MSKLTLTSFATDQSGAVTVDWVVLTSALVGLGLAVMFVVSGGVEAASGNVAEELANIDPLTDPFTNANQRVADGIE